MAVRSSKGSFLRIVSPKYSHSSGKNAGGVIIVVMAVFIWLFPCVWLSSQAVKYNYEINELVKTRDRLKAANRALDIRMQSMLSSGEVARLAREKYGFKQPGEAQVIPLARPKKPLEIIAGIMLGKNGGSRIK
ncbi:MAG TPA: hypothetical protein P5511_05170 [Candidatus Goldiibacteriota bacterium]|nr:hypothetical protein [Candidatus Goldiibacteriota bacterium]